MEEFVLGLQPNGGRREAQDVFTDQDGDATSSGTIANDDMSGLTLRQEEASIEGQVKEGAVKQDGVLHEVAVGKGLAGALKFLQDRGTLNEGEGETTDKKKSKAVGYKDGPKEIRIERTDEFGRVMTMEAFRELSHKFHGKGSGKAKQEKRPRKYQEELKAKRMKSSDTPAERWKMEGALARARLLLRAAAWLFSFLALVVMATDVHGRGGAHDFSTYLEYNYCLGVSIIALLYATAQLLRDLHRLSSGRDLVARRKVAAIVDFTGDQVVAYFLISGLSAAAPVTDYMRQGADNLFDDSAAAAISMAFFTFVAIGLSALVSGYNLSLEALV